MSWTSAATSDPTFRNASGGSCRSFCGFVVELVAGLASHSTALLADSVDMLGDAIVYGFSLYVVGRGVVWQARAALLQGGIMAALDAGVLAEVVVKIARGLVPSPDLMIGIGCLAFAANGAVLIFLWRHRGDDINMRSAWLCSRNRSEEHTSELQSHHDLVCRLLLEKKKK